ncbi:MAG: 4'-phosphopantetheinyl transferase superfamily protein [Phycisphaerae bacterium]
MNPDAIQIRRDLSPRPGPGDGPVVWLLPRAEQADPLWQILAEALGISVEAVRLETDGHGRRILTQVPAGVTAPQFAVAHTEGWNAIALLRRGQVGIDLEMMRPLADLSALARDYLTSAERVRLDSLAPNEQGAEFYRLWTTKEALAKALGLGLSVPFGEMEIAPLTTPTDWVRIYQSRQLGQGWQRWHQRVTLGAEMALLTVVWAR